MLRKLIVVSIVIGLGFSIHATERMVLGELFTNTSCGPCRPANLALDGIAEAHDSILAVIRYHTWWPSAGDPFYAANITENRNRTNYYGADYVPHFWVDGFIDGGSSYSTWEGLILSRATVQSPLFISLTGTYCPDDRTGVIEAKLIGTGHVTQLGLKLHFVLTESNIQWNAPNGLTEHDQTMRDMIPDAGGESITIDDGDTLVRSRNFEVDEDWEDTNCELVVFVQSDTTHEVLQATKIHLDSLRDQAPVISWIGREPFMPTSQDSVLVSAVVTDDRGLDSVKIEFIVDQVDTTSIPMYPTVGDTFQTYLPQQTDGAFVQFMVVARDTAGCPSGPHEVWSNIYGYFSGTTPIEVIRANDLDGNNLYLGYPVRVTGVATVGSGTFLPQDQGIDIYIQDKPSSGINLFDSLGTDTVNLGDSLVAVGLIDQLNGNLRLVPYDSVLIAPVGQGSLPQALLVTPADLDETLEGKLIRIDTVFNTDGGDEWPSEGSDADVEIALWADTALKTIMRIDADTDIDGSGEPPHLFNVVGICLQDDPTTPYDEGYHIAPRSEADILPIGNLFIRADSDTNGILSMNDALYILRHLFVPQSPPPTCMDAADSNDDGVIGISDGLYILRYLFVPQNPEPPPPFPDCWLDPTPEDTLNCGSHQCMQ